MTKELAKSIDKSMRDSFSMKYWSEEMKEQFNKVIEERYGKEQINKR